MEYVRNTLFSHFLRFKASDLLVFALISFLALFPMYFITMSGTYEVIAMQYHLYKLCKCKESMIYQ